MPDSTIFALGGVGGDAQPDSGIGRSLSLLTPGVSWADTRGDATTNGSSYNASSGTLVDGVHNGKFQGRGTANAYICDRSFFAFDLSGESGTIASADLKIKTDNLGDTGTNQSTVYAVASTALANGVADYGNVFSGAGGTTLTSYGSTAISTTEQYHTWTINSDGISAINDAIGSGILTIGLMDYYDYNNSDPGTGNETKIKIFYANTLGTGSDPKLELTLATAGFGHKTIGVASANIGKVKGVATANIGKVIGVD